MKFSHVASADTESNLSSNSSSSTSVGVSVGIGPGGAGLSLDIAVKVTPQVQQDSNSQMNQLLQPVKSQAVPVAPLPSSKLETLQNFTKGK